MAGTGPGTIAPDGTPVDFCALLPAGDEPGIIAKVVPAGGTILELGAGTGRVTMPLTDLGYRVVAVDESPDMLAHITGVETVRARIQDLRLQRRFDAVILGSYLLNWPDDVLRHAFLSACRAHVRDNGVVLIEWRPSEWHDGLAPAPAATDGTIPDGIAIRMISLRRPEDHIFAATLHYWAVGRTWTQSVVSERLTDSQLTSQLRRAQLRLQGFLTPDRSWMKVVRLRRPQHPRR